MPSVIDVKEKTVNNREVISFSKQYRDQEHEVFTPKEHAVQVLLQLLAVVNRGRESDEAFVLARKDQLGSGDAVAVDGELIRREVLLAVARELFDEDTAAAVEIVTSEPGPVNNRVPIKPGVSNED